ncbi:MAG: glycosyl transferase [Prevotella sp.]|nr:glycosyl transferase [Prevotella sp.]
MIPKLIHYCWFGKKPLPKSALKCISSWKKFFPDYEIKEWNEDNFDVNSILYTQQAYQAKKYAFVSDYARYWILYHHGGLYFDTDVEVIKSMDDIVAKGPFMGVEIPSKKGKVPMVAPGLCLGAEKDMPFYKQILCNYTTLSFLNDDGTYNLKTIVYYNTELLKDYGLLPNNDIQHVQGIWIYPWDYFNPLDDLTGKLNVTENTRSIHWYSKTWSDTNLLRKKMSRLSHRIFGLAIHNIIIYFKKD